jgi:hypothetical protein
MLFIVCSALVSTVNSSDAFAVTEDLVKPTLGIIQPLAGSSLQAGLVTIQGTASDNTGGSGIQNVEIRIDKKSFQAATPRSAGDWSTWSAILDITTVGLHNITARATDNAGNKAWFDMTMTVISTGSIDSTKPKIAITKPSPGYLSIGNTIAIKGTASDNTGGTGISKVEVRIDKKSYLPAIPKSSGDWSTWSITLTSTSFGSHIISARTFDNAGNGAWTDISITTSTTDKFGIKALYPQKPGGEEWFIDMGDPTSDERFEPGATITRNSDGSWKIKSSQTRLEVMTSSGYHPERIDTYNQLELADKGYMQDQKDWKNVEMTGYIKKNAGNEDNYAWYARGGKHSDVECEGTAYKGGLFFSGNMRVAKEQWYNGGYSFSPQIITPYESNGNWLGFKTVIYNNANGGVDIEMYVNPSNDKVTWIKAHSVEDNGGWGNQGDYCGGSPDQRITWGGPIATFRWDSATDVDFKWLSVREIQPPIA